MNINNKNILLIILLFFILFILLYNISNLENLENFNPKEYNNNNESNILKENILIPVAYNTYNNNYINQQNNKKRNNYINNNYLFSKQENSNIDINKSTKAISDTIKSSNIDINQTTREFSESEIRSEITIINNLIMKHFTIEEFLDKYGRDIQSLEDMYEIFDIINYNKKNDKNLVNTIHNYMLLSFIGDSSKTHIKEKSIIPLTIEKHFENNVPPLWIQNYDNIITIMRQIFQVYEFTNQKTIKVFAWVDDIKEPPEYPEGNILKGKSLSGNGIESWLILEIPRMQIANNDPNLYSGIVHEYYHLYQKNNYMHNCIWLREGTAACLEVFFINDYLNINNFENQFKINETIKNKLKTHPSQYEHYSGTDNNYVGSVYMILILIKELQKKNTLKITLNKIFKEFWETPYNSDNDWRKIFNKVFNINISDFYNIVIMFNLENSISYLIPNQPLDLITIFA